MKIIHCADIHLDSPMNKLPKEKSSLRRNELINTFTRMIEYAISENVSAIIIAGDLFDKKKVSSLARGTVLGSIQNNPNISFYYLMGNHDNSDFLSSLDNIPQNLFLFENKWKSFIHEESNERITISGLELSQNISNKTQINSLTEKNAPVLDLNDFNIVVMHGQESEHKAGNKEEYIEINALKNKGIDYLALGHVHAYKYEKLDGRGMYCYPGCLESRGFDETSEHGFALLDIDVLNKTYTHTLIDLSYRHFHKISVDISECTNQSECLEKIKQCLNARNINPKDCVEIILEGDCDIELEFELSYFDSYFEEKYYLYKTKDNTSYKIDYNSLAKDASLKGEFVRLVEKDETLSDSEKAEIIRIGIRALLGEGLES